MTTLMLYWNKLFKKKKKDPRNLTLLTTGKFQIFCFLAVFRFNTRCLWKSENSLVNVTPSTFLMKCHYRFSFTLPFSFLVSLQWHAIRKTVISIMHRKSNTSTFRGKNGKKKTKINIRIEVKFIKLQDKNASEIKHS